MPIVVISPFNVATFAVGGGHFWVYLQYVLGLRQLGCDVYWLERFRPGRDPEGDEHARATFFERMATFGLDGKVLLYVQDERTEASGTVCEFIGVPQATAEAVLRQADLLLNFHYAIDPRVLAYAKRTALVDIDPGLLQLWMSTGQINVPPHDVHLTIGETVGTPAARFPDCGRQWIHIRPPVCLEFWPYTHDPACEAFTTIAGWWSGKWVKEVQDGKEAMYDNNKRVAFLDFIEMPRLTSQALELALYFNEKDVADRELLERHGWRVRHSRETAGTPEQYQTYLQQSRGEFSCAKPSYIKLDTAWVSDRSACYLASGKPVVVQDTGPSTFLPNGEGMFRFTTMKEAVKAFDVINADYERHCRAARKLAETYFDAKQIVGKILSVALE